MVLEPLRNCFLFSFLNETSGGLFVERNKGKILLTNQDVYSQGNYARWGKVTQVGADVVDFGVGDFVLIEAGMWTIGFNFSGQKQWKSDDSKVCAITQDESVTYSY